MKPNARKFGVPAPRWTYYRMGTVEGKRVPTRPSHWVYYKKQPRRGELGEKAPMPLPEDLPIIGVWTDFPNHDLPNPQDIEISFKTFGTVPPIQLPSTAPLHRPLNTLLPLAAPLSTTTPQAPPLPKVPASPVVGVHDNGPQVYMEST
jgi:hypothetical protein